MNLLYKVTKMCSGTGFTS